MEMFLRYAVYIFFQTLDEVVVQFSADYQFKMAVIVVQGGHVVMETHSGSYASREHNGQHISVYILQGTGWSTGALKF
jgi:hypothetical protein